MRKKSVRHGSHASSSSASLKPHIFLASHLWHCKNYRGDSNWRWWTASPASSSYSVFDFPLICTSQRERERTGRSFESTLLKVCSDPAQTLEQLITHKHTEYENHNLQLPTSPEPSLLLWRP